jgi:chromate transporter
MAIPRLIDLFGAFFRVGLTAFGMAILQSLRATALRRGFVSEAEIEEGIALVQLYPGPIMVDLVAFIGYRRRGVPGALCAAAGFILPAVVLMLVLAAAYGHYGDLPAVAALLPGLIAFVVGVVIHVTLDMGRKNLAGLRDGVLALLAFAIGVLGSNMLWAVVGGALVGAANWRQASDKSIVPSTESLNWRRLALPLLCAAGLLAVALLMTFLPGITSDIGLAFLKVGAIAFGNGATILPVMQQMVVDEQHWLTGPEFAAAIAFGQVTPGPILNSATYVGYQVAGLGGALVATVAIFAPGITFTMIFAELFVHVRHLAPVRAAIRGVMAAFVGMLAWVVVSLGLYIADRPAAWVLVAATLFAVRFFKWDMLRVLGASLLLWVAMLYGGLA